MGYYGICGRLKACFFGRGGRSRLVLLVCLILPILASCNVVAPPEQGFGDENSLSPEDLGDDCYDADQDGYGTKGHAKCKYRQIDCDDGDPNINPGRVEIIGDKKDNDCDGIIDQCKEGMSATLANPICRSETNSPCSDVIMCHKDLRCVEGVCKVEFGKACKESSDCIEPLTCGASKKCEGNFCETIDCEKQYPVNAPICSSELATCILCNVGDNSKCSGNDICNKSGFCGKHVKIDTSNISVAAERSRADRKELLDAFIECWNTHHTAESDGMCGSFELDLGTQVTFDSLRSFVKDNSTPGDPFMEEELAILRDMMGDISNSSEGGWKELTIVTDPIPKFSNGDICFWFVKNQTFVSRDYLYVDLCKNYRFNAGAE